LAARIFLMGWNWIRFEPPFEQERQQRQQLETKLQEMTANQPDLEKQAAEQGRRESDLVEQLAAAKAASSKRRRSAWKKPIGAADLKRN